MSEQNIIPSAPQLYPSLHSEANEVGAEFRLKKICDCQKQLEDEISHYKKVSKKYKRAKSIASKITSVSVFLTTLLASSSIATSLSGIGIAVGVPLSLTALITTLISSASMAGSQNFENKVRKHEKTISLAESSLLSMSRLISKALKDGFISDGEFDSILREIEKYFSMKERLRNKQRKDSTVKSEPTKPVDVDALREEIKKISKKTRIASQRRELRVEFEKRSGGFSLLVSRDKTIL